MRSHFFLKKLNTKGKTMQELKTCSSNSSQSMTMFIVFSMLSMHNSPLDYVHQLSILYMLTMYLHTVRERGRQYTCKELNLLQQV